MLESSRARRGFGIGGAHSSIACAELDSDSLAGARTIEIGATGSGATAKGDELTATGLADGGAGARTDAGA